MTTAFAISNNNLLRFETTAPDRVSETLSIRGLGAGENLVGIDFRPQNGWLYGLSATARGEVRLRSTAMLIMALFT